MGVLRQNGFRSPASVPTLRAHAPPARCCTLMAAPPAESQTHAAECTRRRSRVPSEGCVARHAAKKPAGVRALACCILSFFARCFAGRVLRVSGAGTARIPVPDVVGTDGAHTRFVGTNRPRALGKRMEEKKSWSGEVTLLVVAFGGGEGIQCGCRSPPLHLEPSEAHRPPGPPFLALGLLETAWARPKRRPWKGSGAVWRRAPALGRIYHWGGGGPPGFFFLDPIHPVGECPPAGAPELAGAGRAVMTVGFPEINSPRQISPPSPYQMRIARAMLLPGKPNISAFRITAPRLRQRDEPSPAHVGAPHCRVMAAAARSCLPEPGATLQCLMPSLGHGR